MKTSIFMLMAALCAVTILQADAGDKPPFKLSLEGMVLNRTNPGSNEIVTSHATGADLFNTDEFEYAWEFNLRATFQVDITENGTVEAVYFGLGEWSDDGGITSDSDDLSVLLNGEFSVPVDAFDGADVFGMETESEMYSIELNYLHTVHPSVRLLAGLRLVSIDERANLFVEDLGSSLGRYDVETENLLVGGQIGVVVDHDLGHDIFVRGGAKLAGFWGHSKQESAASEQDFETTTFRNESAEDDGFAWLFEGEVLLGFRVTRHINVYGGYRLIYVANVASAVDHFVTPVDAVDGADLELSDILYHGPTLGAEVTF